MAATRPTVHLVATRPHLAETIGGFLAEWAPALAGVVAPTTYGDLFARDELAPGVWIFGDLERLTPAELQLGASVADQIEGAGPPGRVLNHPRRALRRAELLDAMATRGINSFRSMPATAWRGRVHFPVFVRRASSHGGTRPLLHGPRDVERTIAGMVVRGVPLDDVLVVEFRNTADAQGFFRKFACHRVGTRLIPAHLAFSREWLVAYRFPDRPDHIAEQDRYVDGHEHAATLRAIFAAAGIEYGRVDYAWIDGRPQIWEINTNPILQWERGRHPPHELVLFDRVAARTANAFCELAAQDPGPRTPLRLDPTVRARARTERRAAVVRRRWAAFVEGAARAGRRWSRRP